MFPGAGTPKAKGSLLGRLAADPDLPATPGAARHEERDHGLIASRDGRNLVDVQMAGLTHTCRTVAKGDPAWFSYDLAVTPDRDQTLLIRLWTPPAGDPDEARGTSCGFEVRAQVGDRNETPRSDRMALARLAQTGTPIGSVGPAARADGSFRDLRFALPATLLSQQKRLTVRFVPQAKKAMGLVAEVRVLLP